MSAETAFSQIKMRVSSVCQDNWNTFRSSFYSDKNMKTILHLVKVNGNFLPPNEYTEYFDNSSNTNSFTSVRHNPSLLLQSSFNTSFFPMLLRNVLQISRQIAPLCFLGNLVGLALRQASLTNGPHSFLS